MDWMTAPVGVRTIVTDIRTMFELRVAGHFLFATNGSASFSHATGLGLEFVASPLFWKRGSEAPLRPNHESDEARTPTRNLARTTK